MTLVTKDRVLQSSTTTGTGTFDLNGAAPAGFQGFVAALGDGASCYYCATDGTDFEVGIGTVTDAATDTLSRDLVLASTNGGAKVDWPAGTKQIFVTIPAAFQGPGVRVHTAAGDVTVGPTDRVIIVAKGTPAASNVIFPAVADRMAQGGWPVTIKDGNIDAGTRNITPVFDGAETADGQAGSFWALVADGDSRTFCPTATEWKVL